MQYIKYLVIISLFIIPLNSAKAISRSFSSSELKSYQIIESSDNKFRIIIKENEFNDLKVHIFKSDDVYQYYFISPEITDNNKFNISFKIDLNENKQIYEWQDNKWQYVPTSYDFENQLLLASLSNRKGKVKLFEITNLETTGQNVIFNDQQLEIELPKIIDGNKVTTNIEVNNNNNNIISELKRISPIYKINLYSNNFNIEDNLSNTDIPFICEPYLTNHLDEYNKNYNEVVKLQSFFKKYEGYNYLIPDGQFDSYTIKAINQFQEKYTSEILEPWGLKLGTGNVYSTTLKKINQIYCEVEKEKNSFIKLKLKYIENNNLAKSIYYLKDNIWQQLISYDNHETNTVTALTKETNLEIALFEELNSWVGEASWYAWKLGNYAASRDFPKGTMLKVTNMSNSSNQGKSVIITVNDYGPELWTGRIIDLDKVAYQQIGNLSGGVMPVKVELIKE